jgi:two-component system NtrC family sensor kinase
MGETTADTRPRPRVLVVDDEENLRLSLGQILGVDHDVTLCASAADALREITAGPRFDAVLCDLHMPRMGGVDLYEALEAQHPEVLPRVAFLTGGAFTPRSRAFFERVDPRRLEKPFTVPELRALLREITAG